MKTHSLAAILLTVVSIFGLNLDALGHGGGGGGGGHGGGGGGHFGGGHFHGYYGGYGGWWGGGLWYPYYYGYGYPYGYPYGDTGPMYYPQYNASRNVASLSREVQQSLAQAGYYRGEVDGQIGPMTRSAIGRYQSAHHLPVTDRIDEPLLQSLRLL